MARQKRKTREENPFLIVEQFAGMVDALFVRYTGKTMGQHLREPQGRPRELPPVGPSWPPEPKVRQPILSEQNMPLADAYAVLGLPPTATLEQAKRNYKHLAAIFHPDKGGYTEAMVLLNRAYEQIMSQKRG